MIRSSRRSKGDLAEDLIVRLHEEAESISDNSRLSKTELACAVGVVKRQFVVAFSSEIVGVLEDDASIRPAFAAAPNTVDVLEHRAEVNESGGINGSTLRTRHERRGEETKCAIDVAAKCSNRCGVVEAFNILQRSGESESGFGESLGVGVRREESEGLVPRLHRVVTEGAISSVICDALPLLLGDRL